MFTGFQTFYIYGNLANIARQLLGRLFNVEGNNNSFISRVFFYFKNGKYTYKQAVGKGTIGKWFMIIAHAIFKVRRRLLQANVSCAVHKERDRCFRIKKAWSAVAESYFEDSLQNKIKYAEKIYITLMLLLPYKIPLLCHVHHFLSNQIVLTKLLFHFR